MRRTILDIDKRLNDIIFEYGLDCDYPNYHRGVMAEQYIKNLMVEFRAMNKKVLCFATKGEDIDYFSFLDKHVGGNIDFKLFDKCSFDKINFTEYDEVYAISLQYAYIVYMCRNKGIVCRSIYLDMKRQGLTFEQECYRICNPFYEDFTGEFSGRKYVEGIQIEHFLLKQYLTDDCPAEEKFFYLKNIYFLSLCMKDFLNASKYISQIIELDIGDNCKTAYTKSWQEIQDLLNQIRELLKNRNKEDIIMNWLDAVGYKESDNMPFLNRCRKWGINFTNAFTVMPYTHETYKTIFKGMLPLSDYFNMEKISDSKLIKDIEKCGYRFKIVSGYMNWFEEAYESEVWHNCGASCSEILWDMLSCLVNMEEPAFLLGHLLMEGHDPNIYSDMISSDFANVKNRRYNARLQMDKQLEYYADLLPSESMTIYMSDHGLELNLLDRVHTNLIITGRKIRNRDIEKMFSYVKFSDMVLQLLQKGTIVEEKLTDDYVRLEYMDLYNGKLIYNIISQKQRLNIFPNLGFQGIITKEYIYANYNIGKEVLLRRDNIIMTGVDYFTLEDEIDEEELLPYFRSMIGDTTKVYEDKRFKYSKYLRKVYENYRNMPHKKQDLLNELFGTFENHSVALRVGGQHTVGMWRMLSEDNRKKINCIIDRNQGCIASVLGYPVVESVDDVNFDDVKVCIPSSYIFRKELLLEMKDYPVYVIDLYDYMKEHGMDFKTEIYKCETLPEKVYDVGFPFEEFE